jgi:hypothetical protein
VKTFVVGLLAFMGCTLSARAAGAQPSPDALGALVRQLVVDSLRLGGGARGDLILVAADSASAVLLRMADVHTVAAPGPEGLTCPASTEADGRPSPAPVGYVMRVALATGADTSTRELRITKSCGFRYRGQHRGYAEGGAWELRSDGGRWHVTARLYLWET